MAILGSLLQSTIHFGETIRKRIIPTHDSVQQEAVLTKLILKAKHTAFGRQYDFEGIVRSAHVGEVSLYDQFKETVPIHDYNKIYNEWWKYGLLGYKNICWPGRIKYYALSSGTSEASTKYIPLTKDMFNAIRKASIRQIFSLSNFKLESKIFESGILMLGGCTELNQSTSYYEGDLSGIQASKLPFWFQLFYKPGKKIASNKDWENKLTEITRNAKNWDIGIIVGVPAWIQILMEKIIAYYNVETIHDIWPNLKIYVHGGVSFEPYRKGFEKLLSEPLLYIETYLASEGFIAFQKYPNQIGMSLVLDNGIFYEFVPFDESNFTSDGTIKESAETKLLGEVSIGVEYALLISTCTGAWRYLLGDVVKFVSANEIIITGRTKQFISLCGEHLSIDNMNRAIMQVSNQFNITISEFTVVGVPYDSLFAHHWYIGTDDVVSKDQLKEALDAALMELNDDYAVERSAALKEILIDVIPTSYFYEWMESLGKSGGQHKVPRVLKNRNWESWKSFLGSKGIH
ncbi:MAG: GH3 auxin-responsive promoter family protein [Saprospiraceae bacterium]|nr:GH3 auxin-responsive promoter family protein [Candidatus Defluviibacterium haderslevense]